LASGVVVIVEAPVAIAVVSVRTSGTTLSWGIPVVPLLKRGVNSRRTRPWAIAIALPEIEILEVFET
jgi:hypothetical protein